MLTDLSGLPIEQPVQIPSVGHSISTASTRTTAKKGSTSPEGPSRYQSFEDRLRNHRLLKKATANDQLVDRLLGQLDVVDAYLQGETLFNKLEDARLRDIALFQGLLVDKLQALNGNPSYLLNYQHQQKIDEVLPVLMDAIKQRGLTMTAVERKVEVIANR